MKLMKATDVSILDLGLGNFNSVARMVQKIGRTVKSINTPEEILESERLVIPGVGNFLQGSKALKADNLESVIRDRLSVGRPVLGICLGMQLLCDWSDEGHSQGLGALSANVERLSLDSQYKLPHMGWNSVSVEQQNPLLEREVDHRFYFSHSYVAKPNDPSDVIATADYGGTFCAGFARGNLFGVQFHPEKSHRFGLNLLKNFVGL